MSKRLQVVMSEAELDEIRDAASRNRVARERELRGGAGAVREARPPYRAPESALYPFVNLEVRLPQVDLEAIRERYGLRNWTAAVKEAVLRQAIVPMTKEEALAMRGFGWDGDLDEMRRDSPVETW